MLPGNRDSPVSGSFTSPSGDIVALRMGSSWLYSTLMMSEELKQKKIRGDTVRNGDGRDRKTTITTHFGIYTRSDTLHCRARVSILLRDNASKRSSSL